MGQKKVLNRQENYSKFDKLDGSHPIKDILPKGFVDYPARIRKGGKVAYFNYDLAYEMGLIKKDHPAEMNPDLEEKILETFGIQIINEYDQMKNRQFPENEIKRGTYMATRYLQLQHDDKKGRTSGDGRSVWNGQLRHRGKTWDISSGGTGATCLSPATSKFNRFFETGDPSISYGCGYAELDEGIATAILSHVFNSNNIKTEQTVAIIDYGNNISINVRAYQNLLRPSHFFLYLKQDRLDALKALTDYYIENQSQNESWKECPQNKKKYDFFLNRMTKQFAQLAADFEDEYIFCWLDWDGDNILMDGGIIDYGSVRQFGLCHYEYRYDDVERFSTNLLEQKSKAKYTIQTFIQMVDFIKNGVKKNLSDYSHHPVLDEFENLFEQRKNRNILHKMGLGPRKVKQILKRHSDLVTEFRKSFTYFERAKSHQGIVLIPDGVTCDAIFSMRNFLREYPQIMLLDETQLEEEELLEVIKSTQAKEEDLQPNSYRKQKAKELQDSYMAIVEKTSELFQESLDQTLMGMVKRGQIINKPSRITGDAVTCIVDKIIKSKKKYDADELFHLAQGLVASQNLIPENKINFPYKNPKRNLQEMLEIIQEYREGL